MPPTTIIVIIFNDFRDPILKDLELAGTLLGARFLAYIVVPPRFTPLVECVLKALACN